ncbi:MAG: GNAT family N-acetyltransferase [Acidimicrobiales bacterium]
MSEPSLIVRRATDDDLPAAIAVASLALRWRGDEPHEAFFRWKHIDNPAGRSPMWLACLGDEVVGFRTMLRWPFLSASDRAISAVRAVDTATHPDHRRKGVFRLLTMAAVEALNGEGVQFVFNTPNPSSRSGYLTMGWRDEGRVPTVVAPARPSGIVRTVRAHGPARKWSEPCPAGAAVPAVVDDLADLARTLPGGHVRTARTVEHLSWRYGFEPLCYRVLRTDDAAAVIRLRQRGPALEVVVAELLSPSRRAALGVIRRIRREVTADHILLTAHGSGRRPPVPPIPGLGPILTVRPLAGPAPSADAMRLDLGDLELL